ncbi:MAG: hypothetical protein MR210_03255 [Erysipelotrichaceae bacterium]|nr:hypothetical protein [Erysipelotrichaceae bacterium]MDY5252416.1 hypothetical protein [Erysipelotrichaceae bacterium]
MSKQVKKVSLSPEEKAKRRKIKKANNNIILAMIILSVAVTAFFGFNIINISVKNTNASGETLKVDSGSKLSNDLYEIGNNPTDLQKEYFNELTKALKADDDMKAVEFLVKSFIADCFTWTNKDGNYEVGGLQYLYGPKYMMFQTQMRYEFYADLDLYINQYGRENLLEVERVETPVVDRAADYFIGDRPYSAYYIEAKWTYKPSSKIDVNEFQQQGYFTIIDHDGRYEIVSIYDNWD